MVDKLGSQAGAGYSSRRENEDISDLWDRHRDSLYRYVRPMARDSDDAEDVVQETAVRILQTTAAGGYEPRNQFFAWIRRIARNVIIDRRRRDKWLAPLENELDPPDTIHATPESATSVALLMEFLDAQLDECLGCRAETVVERNEGYLRKVAFKLYYVDGSTISEVSDFVMAASIQFGLPTLSESAVNNWLAGGRLLSTLIKHLCSMHPDCLDRLEEEIEVAADLTAPEREVWRTFTCKTESAIPCKKDLAASSAHKKVTEYLTREIAKSLHTSRRK